MRLKDQRESRNVEIDDFLSNMMRQHGYMDDGGPTGTMPRPDWAPPTPPPYTPVFSVRDFLYRKLLNDKIQGRPLAND